MQEQVILVDVQDQAIGLMEKLEAHKKGLLHRAFSVFIFNSKRELLLQQRAFDKYHASGLWTNTCCSHQRVGESDLAAAHRRLQEEMGLSCELRYAFNFIYKASLDNGLTEHEFDHVFIGHSDQLPVINAKEVADYKYADLNWLKQDIIQKPHLYTPWLKICLDKIML